MSLNIAFFISSLDPGGAERVMSELANHMACKGHNVSLITLSGASSFYTLDEKVKLIQLKKEGTFLSKLPRFWGSFVALFVMRRTFGTLKPDVIISFMDLVNMLVLISTIGMKVPVIISERMNPRFRVLPGFVKWLRLKLYPHAARLVMQTETTASYFPESFQKMITLIPNAVKPPENPKRDHAFRATKLISVGRLDAGKDHRTAIAAMSELVTIYPDLHLTIYGQGPLKADLEKQILDLNIGKHVQLAGVTQDVKSALQASDLYLFPTLFEGFPNALCEAMALGLPVIASDAPGNIDVVQDGVNGKLFKAGDKDALVLAIKSLIDDQAERERLGKEAQKLSETYSPERIFAAWEDLIMHII